MMDLIAGFTITQIIVFTITLVLAIKGLLDLIDYFKKRYDDKFNKDYKKKQKEEDLIKHYEACKEQHQETLSIYGKLENKIDNLADSVNNLSTRVDHLTTADLHDAKQFIVREYHYFVEQKKWIDDYSLDTILLRYEDYKAEGGNSYIKTLIDEIKALPKHPPVQG